MLKFLLILIGLCQSSELVYGLVNTVNWDNNTLDGTMAENIGKEKDLWLPNGNSTEDDIAQIMTKCITYGIYRWIYYLMLVIVSITFVVFMIAVPCTIWLAILIRRMGNILERKKAFWENIDPIIQKMKERIRRVADEKREGERMKKEKGIIAAREDLQLLHGYNVNMLRKRSGKDK